MIRHQAFFDTLGSLGEDSPAWRAVSAGLVVLRLVDSYADSGRTPAPRSWVELHNVRASVDQVNDGDPVRSTLEAVVDAIAERGTVDELVCSRLLSYGRALDYEGRWTLAADVFGSVAAKAAPQKMARTAVEANIALGGAARRAGDWTASSRAYSQAAQVADAIGDRAGTLTVQVGIANTYMERGNLPQAQTILDDVIVQSRDLEMPEVVSVALHSRASLAQKRGDHAEGIKLAYEALNLTTKPAARDAVLADIAALFSDLGMSSSARDANLIVAATTQNQLTRSQATINLLELAAGDGNQSAFDGYASELRSSPLPSWLVAHYLLYLGEGMRRFGRMEAAEAALTEAVSFSSANQIHQVMFQAEDALAALRSDARVSDHRTAAKAPALSDDVVLVARALTELREAAVA